MASISKLSVKSLVKVLTHLKGGSLGFDPFRDDRTNNKAKLLAFIVQNHDNTAIIDAIKAVTGSEEFNADSSATATQDAAAFVSNNSVYHYTGKLSQEQYQALQKSTGMVKREAAKAYTFDTDVIKETPKTDRSHADDKLEALKKLLAPTIDESQIHAIMDARAQDYVDNILEATNKRLQAFDTKIDGLQFPTTVHVLKAGETKAIDLGHQHKQFPTLLKMSQARTKDGMRLNIWLKGPAGSGKTTAAKKVSEALGMQFQFNGAISTEYELMGFKDASGTYHSTAFREIFEKGGVYLFDEVDSSLPKAVLAFNAALANGECRFPDAMVNRHPDCVIIAGANTAGNGANSDYVGRMKQDLAFLNRFVMLDWPLDEALEKALASNKDWCRKVQKFRSNAVKRSIKGHIISPRATFYGEALLAVGIDEETVEQAVLRGALTKDQWEQLCQ